MYTIITKIIVFCPTAYTLLRDVLPLAAARNDNFILRVSQNSNFWEKISDVIG